MAEQIEPRVELQDDAYLGRARDVVATAMAQPDVDGCLRHLRRGLLELGFNRAGIWVVDPAEPTRLRGTWGTSWEGTELDEHELTHPIGTFLGSARLVLGERMVLRRYGRPAEPRVRPDLGTIRLDGPPNCASIALRTSGVLLGVISTDMLLGDGVIDTHQVHALEVIAEIVAARLAPRDSSDNFRIANDQLRAAIDVLHTSETRYRSVSQPTSDFTCWIRVLSDGSTETEWISDSVERVTGYPPWESAWLLNQNAITHAEDLPLARQSVHELQSGRSTTTEYRVVTRLGETKWLRLRGWPIWDDAHYAVSRMYVEAQDITERKRADEALRKSAETQRVLAEASQQFANAADERAILACFAKLVIPTFADGFSVHLTQPDGLIRQVVTAHSDDRLISSEQARIRNLVVEPDSQRVIARVIRSGRPAMLEDVPAVLASGRKLNDLDLLILRDGRLQSAMIVPIAARGQVFGTISLVTAESGRHFGSSELSLAVDLAGRAGLAIDNVRLLVAERGARQDAEAARQEITALYQATKQITESLDLSTTLGNILDAAVMLSGSSTAGICLLDTTGTVLSIAAARGQYADAMRGLRLSPEGVTWTAAATGEIIVCADLLQDSRWIPAPGLDPQALRSGLFVPLKVDDRVIGVLSAWSHDVDYFTPTHQRLLQGFSEQASLAVQRARDIEQRQRLEEQLRQSQKMEAIGQLAGGVAHDFNNLLTVMFGYGQLLLDQLPPQSAQHEEVREILKAAESAATLTRQLLAFSRRQIITLREIDLNEVVEQLGKMLRRVIGEDVTFATVLAPNLGRIRADTGQIEQVLMNLAANARDAMPTGGRLTIETANVTLRDDDPRDPPESPAGSYVMLAISDTGVGMSPEIKARIFEPFFTTKAVGQGTGLGLAAVYGAVTQSGGAIGVTSELGRGTTFRLYFPRLELSTAVPPASQLQPTVAHGTETILLVEDETSVRALAQTALRSHGYSVLEAASGDQAIRLAGVYAGRIHLLIADVVMPVASGSKVVEEIVARDPAVKVLYVSGYTSDVVVRHGVIEDRVDFLQKPYTPLTLCQKVREILDRT
jgi:PAS domain S-box-containing protein